MEQSLTRDVRELVEALPLPETIADPYAVYARLRDHTPVYGYRDYPPGTVPNQDEPVTAWVLMKYAPYERARRGSEPRSLRIATIGP